MSQRMEALAVSWQRARARAELLARIRAASRTEGARLAARALLSVEETTAALSVELLLRAVPWIGPKRARRMLRRARVAGGAQLRHLRPQRRRQLARMLAEYGARPARRTA